jgi:rhamnogalacturonan endolyase
MKKKTILLLSMLLAFASSSFSRALKEQTTIPTTVSQMEKLDRAPVALKAQGGGIFLSWRLLGTDDADATTFDVLADGEPVVTNLSNTNYIHKTGTIAKQYQIVTHINGEPRDTSYAIMPWTEDYLKLKLIRPANGSQGGSYSPNDMSVGDVDGDGNYEFFVKWDPSNQKDNSQDGMTDNVYLDCYKVAIGQTANNCQLLWRIDLGRNIRAGAHYTQYMVYDFDGNGCAELMCKTAPGSKDGLGQYVNQAATDEKIRAANNAKVWLSGSGRMNGGHEYLTVFDGLTGKAIHTIAYNPNRNAKSVLSEASGSFNWDDRSGRTDNAGYNRGDRYLAAVAHIDGPNETPAGIFCRGYYTYAFIWAVKFDGEFLVPQWFHASDSKTSYKLTTYDADGNSTTQTFNNLPAPTSGGGSRTMYSNGNHNMSVADVDNDGFDEILWGSAALNHDGTLRYATGFGHGDAIHLADMNPERPGLELFEVHEEKGTYAWDLHDASTGEIIFKGGPSGVDNGRGMAAQLDAKHHAYFFSSGSAKEQRSAMTGEVMSKASTSVNFRIYWDGDLQDELLDGTKISKWNGNGTTQLFDASAYNQSQTCNSTKSTPNISGDLFGDWREEVIFWSKSDNATLNVFTTNIPSDYMVPTLMHDHTYRLGICWQNTAYNQPPHLGYFLPDYVEGFSPVGIAVMEKNSRVHTTEYYNLNGQRMSNVGVGISIVRTTDDSGRTIVRKILNNK